MSTFAERFGIPFLGVGVGLRREYADQLCATSRQIDWIECIPENYLTFGGKPRKWLHACRERWPIVSHGVALNLGGPDALDEDYVAALGKLANEISAPFVSDHISYSRLAGRYLHDLLPVPFCEEMVEHLAARSRHVAHRVGRPLVLENPSYYATMPGSTMSESAFLGAVLEQADAGFLLDVNNVYVNARNHGYDARSFIDSLPLDRVVQIHLAGHTEHADVVIDTHIGPTRPEVWDLYRYTVKRTGPVSTLIEWDHEIPAFDIVADEADRAREILDTVREGR